MNIKQVIFLLVILLFTFTPVEAADDCVDGEESLSINLLLTEHTVLYPLSQVCKPQLVDEFTAIKTFESWDFDISWSKEHHDLWHVDRYEVRVNEDAVYSFDYDEALPISIDDLADPGINEGLPVFEIRACSVVGADEVCGDWVSTETQCENYCTDNSYPVPQIIGLPDTNSTGDIDVNWSAVTYPDYELQMSVNGAAFQVAVDSQANHHTFINQNNGVYAFQVRNRNGNIYSKFSPAAVVEVELETPVFNYLATENNTADYIVSWSEVSYENLGVIYQLEESANGSPWILISDNNSRSISFVNKPSGSNYEYRVRACRENNNCSDFAQQTISTVVSLDVPQIYNLDPITSTENYTVNWSFVSFDNETVDYELQTSINGGQWSTVLNDYAHSYEVVNHSVYDVYKFRLRACREGNNCSGYSDEVSVTHTPLILPAVTTFNVFEDSRTSSRILTWEKDPNFDYEQLSVIGYGLLMYDDAGQVIDSRNIGIDSLQALVLYSTEPVRYGLSICTDTRCGPEVSVGLSQIGTAISKVIDVEVKWSALDSSSPQFRFEFSYPPELLESTSPDSGKPDYFLVETEFAQQNGDTTLQIIPIGYGDTVSGWDSQWFSYNQMVGNNYRITACNTEVGCGLTRSISFGAPVTSNNIPTPIWTENGVFGDHYLLEYYKGIQLEWTFPSNVSDEQMALIDYIEVKEKSPKTFEMQTFKSENGNVQKERIYYVDSINEPLLLNRLSYGNYDFELRACHRDRDNGDVCSSSSGEFKVNEADIKLNRTDISWALIQGRIEFQNYGWYYENDDDTKPKQIKWEMSRTTSFKPDYFIIRSVTSGVSACNTIRINNADMTNFVDGRYWSSDRFCDGFGEGQYLLHACANGVGCGPFEFIDTTNDDDKVSAPQHPNDTDNNIGGPGDLSTGMWMNGEQNGVGWHFYWASQLRHDSDDYDKYGRAYDLIAYWFSYQQIDGFWTPVWFESELKQVNGDLTEEAYFEGQLYYHKMIDNEFTKINAGVLQVLIGNTNREAKIRMKLNYSEGLFSPDNASSIPRQKEEGHPYVMDSSDGFIEMDIVDIAVEVMQGGIPNAPYEGRFGKKNDADHFAGIYQLDPDENGFSTHTMLTAIDRKLEINTLALFDDAGLPIWIQGTSCNGNWCSNPNGDYFDDYINSNGKVVAVHGFDPLGRVPDGYDLKNNLVNIGEVGRCFSDGNTNYTEPDRFKRARLKLIVEQPLEHKDEDGNVILRRSLFHNSNNSSDNCNDNNMAQLVKRASLHDIRYFVNGQNESINQCDPNDINGPGGCDINFTWYTDDDFLSIEPYYTDDNWVTSQKLSELCPGVPTEQYVTTQFHCVIEDGGTYQFQLRKDKYGSTTGETIIIAESNPLLIADCDSPHCESNLGGPATPPSPLSQVDNISTINANDTVGSTTGAFDVDESGAANYTIPVFAPKGRGGLSPQLALSYNSNAGNGIAGIGWNISGISAITRCLRSPEHDPGLDFYPPIQLNNDDAFCLDGQRLFLDTGTHGENGATYRTEIESFSNIKIIGEENGSPKKFEIKTKNGEIRVYGSPGDSFKANRIFSGGDGAQIKATDGSGVNVGWLLNKIEDRYGNNITYQWDTQDGESYLSRVQWSKHATEPHHYKIEFNYSASQRKDAFHHYGMGSENKQLRRLEEVVTYIKDSPTGTFKNVRSLKIAYEDDAQGNPLAASGLNRLSSITECANNGQTCLQPVNFTWDKGRNQVGFKSSALQSNITGSLTELGRGGGKLIDINGDGNKEYIFVKNYEDGGIFTTDLEARIFIAYAKFDGIDTSTMNCDDNSAYDGHWRKICDTGIEPFDAAATVMTYSASSWHVYDFNGDGYEDIITASNIAGENQDTWKIYLSNGSKICKFGGNNGCLAPIDTGILVNYIRQRDDILPEELNEVIWTQNSFMFDLTGDGLPELIQMLDSSNGSSDISLQIDSIKRPSNGEEVLEFESMPSIYLPLSEMYLHSAFCNEANPNGPADFCYVGILPGDTEPVWDVAGIMNISPATTDANGDAFGDLIINYKYTKRDGLICFDQQDARCETVSLSAVFSRSKGIINGTEQEYLKRLSFIGLEYIPATERDFSNVAIKSINAIDINGDGLSDFIYRKLSSQLDGFIDRTEWAYQLNEGLNDEGRINLSEVKSFNLEQVADTDDDIREDTNDEYGRKFAVHFIDYDLDGDIDILYPENHSTATGNSVNFKLRKYSLVNPYSTAVTTSLIASKSNVQMKKNIHIFSDFNGDGFVDYFRLARGSNEKKQLMNYGVNPWRSRNKITNISMQMNTKSMDINIEYEAGVLSTVYSKAIGSAMTSTASNYDADSPVFDVMLPQYLVRKVDRPTGLSDNSTTSVLYHYSGLKVQAGGRGSLGFSGITTYDLENNVKTETLYNQEFPFIGMPISTKTTLIEHLNGYYQYLNCPSGNSICPSLFSGGYCDPNIPGSCVDPIEISGTERWTMNESYSQYKVKANFKRGSSSELGQSLFPYVSRSADVAYELRTNDKTKVEITDFSYNEDIDNFFGNLTNSDTYICRGDTQLPTSTQSISSQCSFGNGKLVHRKRTANTYHDSDAGNTSNWLLGRLDRTNVYDYRMVNGEEAYVGRSTTYLYDLTTGQLLEEKVTGDRNQFLRTRYKYDDYGQIEETFQCSNHLSEANCETVPTKGRPKDNTYIHRYSKTEYDSTWNEYVENTYEPFTTGYQRFNAQSLSTIESSNYTLGSADEGNVTVVSMGTVISRDIYGQAEKTIDIFGQASKTVYGAFGEPHATANSKGETTKTYKYWCNNTGAPYFCPSVAAMVTVVTTSGAPTKRVYSDILGREVRSQVAHFEANQWQTVDTDYDRLGRTERQSEPYLTREQNGTSITVTPIYWTITEYDELDRVISILSPSHCVEDITVKYNPANSTTCSGTSIVETITSYDGLTVSTMNANGQVNTKVYDESGQVVQIQDAMGNLINYTYDPSGNLLTTTSYKDNTAITINMTYDKLGRKLNMNDPDKGDWSYQYNAMGDLIRQTKVGANTHTDQYFDIRGRMFFRKEPGVRSFWEYDLYGDYGLLQEEHARGELTTKGYGQSVFYSYDQFGRNIGSEVDIYDGRHGTDLSATYTTASTYDQYGRVFQTFDATDNGLQYQYNAQGYQLSIQDAADGMNGQYYYQVVSTNARGQVLEEMRHGQFSTYRSYSPHNGFLENILTIDSQGLVVQDQNFAFDKIGNLIRRSDLILTHESGIIDPIQSETFAYDDLNRLLTEHHGYNGDTNYQLKGYVYDDTGNLTNKAGTSLFYNDNRPHAVSSTSSGYAYEYDDFGNMDMRTKGDETLTIEYTHFDKPSLMHKVSSNTEVTSKVAYGTGRSRYVRTDTKPGFYDKVTHYIGSVEVIERADSTGFEFKRYIGDLVIDGELGNYRRSTWDYNYLLKDHIGSTHVVVNKQGQTNTRMSFNSWGQRRQPPLPQITDIFEVYPIQSVWSVLGDTIDDTTNRGFTGHEHFDEIGIIHMNGRIYDPVIGRFLQADPLVQDPFDTQSLNRYSYVMNNPLSYTDPTGYARLRKDWWRLPVAVAITVFSSGMAGNAAWTGVTLTSTQSFAVVVAGGALSGAAAGGGFKSIVKGAVFAAITFGIGHGLDGKGGLEGANRVLAHSVVSGVSAEIDGGHFGHGFASALLSQGLGGAKIFNPSNGESGVGSWAIVNNAILQGTISEMTGGKFANGAVTGAFRTAFNDTLSRSTKEKAIQSGIRAGIGLRNKINNVKTSNRLWEEYDNYKGDPIGAFVVKKDNWFSDDEYLIRDDLDIMGNSTSLEPWNYFIGKGMGTARPWGSVSPGDIQAVLINTDSKILSLANAFKISNELGNVPIFQTIHNNDEISTYKIQSNEKIGTGTCALYSGKDTIGYCN